MESELSTTNSPMTAKMDDSVYASIFKGQGLYGMVGAVLAIAVPLFLSVILVGKKKEKQRGVPVQVGGEAGFAMRNSKFTKLVEVPWEGANTLAALFEQSCKKHSRDRFLGTRKLISRDFITASDGRKFEKLHLGEYQWETYEQAFERTCNFASGIVNLGHDVDTRVAIFSETRAEWLLAFQGCFRCRVQLKSAAKKEIKEYPISPPPLELTHNQQLSLSLSLSLSLAPSNSPLLSNPMAIHRFTLVSLLLILGFVSNTVQSLRFDLQSGHTKCISEDIKTNAMTVGKYSIVNPSEGHPLPDSHKITVRVTSQYGNSYHYADHVPSGQFAFQASEAGDYMACFWASDHKPQTTITVDFDWKSGVAAKDWTNVAKKGSIDAMEIELKKLYETVSSIHDEMYYLREREEEMQELNRTTNSRMGWLSFLSLFVCLSVAGLQLWHLKTFFEKKKLI